jgi:hypothetical protein
MQALCEEIVNCNSGHNPLREWEDAVWTCTWRRQGDKNICEWISLIPFTDELTRVKHPKNTKWKYLSMEKIINPHEERPLLERF